MIIWVGSQGAAQEWSEGTDETIDDVRRGPEALDKSQLEQRVPVPVTVHNNEKFNLRNGKPQQNQTNIYHGESKNTSLVAFMNAHTLVTFMNARDAPVVVECQDLVDLRTSHKARLDLSSRARSFCCHKKVQIYRRGYSQAR